MFITEELIGVRDLKALAPLTGRLLERGLSPELGVLQRLTGAVLKGEAVLNLPLYGIGGFLLRAIIEK
jgi:hypothetical protein